MNYPELHCYINKLKIQQTNLERTAEDILRTLEGQYDGQIREEYNALNKTREQELYPLRRNISENYRCLKYLKINTIEKNLQNIDIGKLKEDMINLENRHEILKEQIHNEINYLCKLEASFTMEVINYEMKITDSFKSENDPNKKSTHSLKYATDHHLCEEVKEFLSFLNDNGGHEGGWTQDDHSLFLKIFTRIKNKKQLIQSLQNLFPDMSRDDLLQHIDWYTTYLELRNKQKIAIERWREGKAKKEEKKIEPVEEPKPKAKINPEKKKLIKEQVEKWKAEKQQKIEQELKSSTQKVKKTKSTEKQKQVKSQETREQLRKWKSAKEAKEKAEQLAKEILYLREKERRMLLANKLIREFQNQDNSFISKRMNQLKINVEPPSSKTQVTDKKDQLVSRDPERLFKPTKQWLAKTAPDDSKPTMFENHLPLKKIPKLGIPVWRVAVPQE